MVNQLMSCSGLPIRKCMKTNEIGEMSVDISIFHDTDVNLWVNTLGYFGLAAVIFAETGLFFCFFLPGDSLLFAAGMFAARGIFVMTNMVRKRCFLVDWFLLFAPLSRWLLE